MTTAKVCDVSRFSRQVVTLQTDRQTLRWCNSLVIQN